MLPNETAPAAGHSSQCKEIGLSQAAIAEAVGVSIEEVAKWEEGEDIPCLTPKQMQTLCQKLQVSLDTLATWFE